MGGVPTFTVAFVSQREAAAGESPDGIEAWFHVQFLNVSELSVVVLSRDLGLCGPSLVLARPLEPPTWVVTSAQLYGAAFGPFVFALMRY